MKAFRWVLTLVIAALLAAFALQTWFGHRSEEAPIPILGPVPPFTLVRVDGAPLTADSLRGRVWVAAFLFTRCRGQCPVLVGNLRALQDAIGATEPFRLVSVSVDPEHDTPAVLAAFAEEAGADADRWWFVTGERDSIYRLAREGFLLGVERAGDPEGKDRDEPILHSPRFVLVDEENRVRGYYDGTDGDERLRLERDARWLLAAAKR